MSLSNIRVGVPTIFWSVNGDFSQMTEITPTTGGIDFIYGCVTVSPNNGADFTNPTDLAEVRCNILGDQNPILDRLRELKNKWFNIQILMPLDPFNRNELIFIDKCTLQTPLTIQYRKDACPQIPLKFILHNNAVVVRTYNNA